MAAPENLLAQLQARGDLVAVENGRLVVTPASGRPVPRDWLEQYGRRLLIEAAAKGNKLALEYLAFSVGNYGTHRAGGVTLQFRCMTTGQALYTIFNADTHRQRTTKHGRKGDPLPKDRFIVGKRSAFYLFWESTGLPYHRLSDFHDYMGNLKGLTYTASIESGERLAAQSLCPLWLAAPDKNQTTSRQAPDNCPTRLPDKETRQIQQASGFQPEQTTGLEKHGNTAIRECGYTGAFIPPDQQSDDEWLADYCRN